MIPICLVTGFLGAGKTTLLKNIVAGNRDRKIVYLINEFSARDVDGAIVSAENPNVVSIPGGSIFCKCLVTEFISRLKQTSEDWSDADGVVIEASGMADPRVIEVMLRETGLDSVYRLATVVSIVDPNSFLKLRYTLPNISAQIEASDLVLVNKTDCNPEEINSETVDEVRSIKPTLDIVRTVNCEADFDLFAEHSPRGLQGEYAKCRDPHYAAFASAADFDPERLEAFVLENSDRIYRVKGRLAGEFFDYSSSGVKRIGMESAAEKGLAWVVRGGEEEDIRSELKRLEEESKR